MLGARYCSRQYVEKDVGEQTQAPAILPSRIAAVVTRWQQACDGLLSAGRTTWVVDGKRDAGPISVSQTGCTGAPADISFPLL